MEGGHCVHEPLLSLHKFGGLVRGVLLSVSVRSSSSLYSCLASQSLLHGHSDSSSLPSITNTVLPGPASPEF